jgi:hypothetical protein
MVATEETIAVYNGRYHGGWVNLHPSSNATIAITSQHVKVQIATGDLGPQPGAIPGKLLPWSGVKSLHVERHLFGSEEVGRAVYTEVSIGLADGATVALDVPNVEPLEIWRSLDRVQAFRDRIPDSIAAQISNSKMPAPTVSVPSPPLSNQSAVPPKPISPTSPPVESRRLLRRRNVLGAGLVIAAVAIFEAIKHPVAAVAIGVIGFVLLVIIGMAAKSFNKSVQKIQGHARCVSCKSRLKAANGQYGTTCRKCGTVQPWATT